MLSATIVPSWSERRSAQPTANTISHTVETDISVAGDTMTNRERETIVFRRDGDGWIAFHEHLSVLP